MKTKSFPARVLLTATTGRLLTKSRKDSNGINDLYALLNWMTEDDLFTHQLPRSCRECSPWLLRWFPELKEVEAFLPDLDKTVKLLGAEKGVESWLKKVCKKLSDSYKVPRIPKDDHEHKDAYDELVEMQGTDENIILLGPDGIVE